MLEVGGPRRKYTNKLERKLSPILVHLIPVLLSGYGTHNDSCMISFYFIYLDLDLDHF
jgi:hypothetical protein